MIIRTIHDLNEGLIRRYWEKVDVGGPDDCWEWRAATMTKGYGVLGLGRRLVQAKHIALILDGKPRPDAPADHALHGPCSNRLCVNPTHLRWGTNDENVGDMLALGRQAKGARYHRSGLTEEAVRSIRTSADDAEQIATRHNITRSTVYRIRNRTLWAHA